MPNGSTVLVRGLVVLALCSACALPSREEAQPTVRPRNEALEPATQRPGPGSGAAARAASAPRQTAPKVSAAARDGGVAPVVSAPAAPSRSQASGRRTPGAKSPALPPVPPPELGGPPPPTPPAPMRPAAPALSEAPRTTGSTLDLKSLEERLKDTKAIGLLTKLSLKNQVDDLVGRFKAYHSGQRPPTLPQLRKPYELLLMKLLSLLQDADPGLAQALNDSREAIWGILSDRSKFDQYA